MSSCLFFSWETHELYIFGIVCVAQFMNMWITFEKAGRLLKKYFWSCNHSIPNRWWFISCYAMLKTVNTTCLVVLILKYSNPVIHPTGSQWLHFFVEVFHYRWFEKSVAHVKSQCFSPVIQTKWLLAVS